jgi:hypothetical protein
MPRFLCPSCERPWVPAGALRRGLFDSATHEDAPATTQTCPRCEVAFERALWVAFDPAQGKAAAYREAERLTAMRRRESGQDGHRHDGT